MVYHKAGTGKGSWNEFSQGVLFRRYLDPTTPQTYHAVMQRRGLQPEVVDLPHGTEGYWLGNKNAKNVIIYYHGTSKSYH